MLILLIVARLAASASLKSSSLDKLPQGSMLQEYLAGTEYIDRCLALPKDVHGGQSEKGEKSKDKHDEATKELERFMNRLTDPSMVKEAKAFWQGDSLPPLTALKRGRRMS